MVEVTILLSDQSSNKRVIGIKPVNQKEDSKTGDSTTSQKYTIEQAEKIHEDALQKQQQAEAIIAEAEKKAEQLLIDANATIEQRQQDWEKEKQSLIELTKKQAYEDGYEEGKKKALNDYENMIAKASDIIELSNKDYEQKVEQSEETILQLGIKAAEKILHKELEENPKNFTSIIKSVLEEVKQLEHVAIYVHPDQYQEVLEQKHELQYIMDHHANLSIYPKNNINTYQCYVESSFGRVDASIDSQLEELRLKLSILLEEASLK